MIDNLIKAATCRIVCGKTYGTGFLISESLVISARHCVIEAIESREKIELNFPGDSESATVIASIAAEDPALDVCLLTIAETSNIQPLQVSAMMPREGAEWRSFGYPLSKTLIGHRIAGNVAHVLDVPRSRMDIDLAVEPSSILASYSGLSGAPVVSDGICVGIIRLKVDGSVGAISIHAITQFLKEIGFQFEPSESAQESRRGTATRAKRIEFQEEFERKVGQAPGEYLFLEGAHGVGKTTFCSEYSPISESLLVLGTYSLSSPGRAVGAIVRAQPEIFFDWILTTVTTLLTGKPPRKEDRSYATLVQDTATQLKAFAKYCQAHNRHGILFIDGINDAIFLDSEILAKLIGLLPPTLPLTVSIVFTAPNFEIVAKYVAEYIKRKNVISLPRLSEASCMEYCSAELLTQSDNLILVRQICEKAQGHPLYLRYLIEYVNGSENQSLDEFPVLAGAIEDYYESLWQRLNSDTDALNLLAIIVRMRWGIQTTEILRLLSPPEQTAFSQTISRIRHLLQDSNSTEIYHSSFAEFVRTKTVDLEEIIQERIATFCSTTSDTEYATLNSVFHLLRSDVQGQHKAVSTCGQEWVDKCVSLCVEPDALLADIEEALSAAIRQTRAVEVIRLLLLLQRVSFRYNQLFAQSAFLIADAMIALGRPQEVIKHTVRYGRLIVPTTDALKIAFRLIESGYDEHATAILILLQQRIAEAYKPSKSSLTVNDQVDLCRQLIQIYFYTQLSTGEDRSRNIVRLLVGARDYFQEHLAESHPNLYELSLAQIQSISLAILVHKFDKYYSIAELKDSYKNEISTPAHLMTLLFCLLDYSDLNEIFGACNDATSLSKLFFDLQELLESENRVNQNLYPIFIDKSIELDAPAALIEVMSQGVALSLSNDINIREENGVDVSYPHIQTAIIEWRSKAYLDGELECPLVGSFDENHWLTSLDQLLRAIAWCEGRARRARADGNAKSVEATLSIFKSRVLPCLQFSLAERVEWKDSYAIPEGVFPIAWKQVTIVLRDCYPTELPQYIKELTGKLPTQFGLYSEGFRACLATIMQSLTGPKVNEAASDPMFNLLQGWKNYVIEGIENRHELVPDLLTLIPLFVKVGAHEEASKLYERVLSVSMGPSWYKEDQLAIMTTTLQQMSDKDALYSKLSTVAGYLERASGEMTFQRFVRHEKATFLGELFRRNLLEQGVRYFKRQSCGNMDELLQDVQSGKTDRVSPTIGMRYPGGALDEQQAVLRIVENIGNVDWKLRWALLEVFQCGDKRHIPDFAAEYANIINHALDANSVSEMFQQLSVVIGAEVSSAERDEFIRNFCMTLDPLRHAESQQFIGKFQSKDRIKRDPLIPEDDNELNPEQGLEQEPEEELLYAPGLFGKQAAMKAADKILKTAEQHLKRLNIGAAKAEAVNALKTVQDGGWGIWGQLSSSASRAEEMLCDGDDPADNLIHLYGPLIENERYAAKWRIASHLIGKITYRLSKVERNSLLDCVLEHIRLLVGNSDREIGLFGFIDANQGNETPIEIFKIFIWLLDHPHWLRRYQAAGMILWLIEGNPAYFNEAAQIAFSNSPGYGGDIISGIIDAMSRRRGVDTWQRLVAAVDIKAVVRDCKHVGRIVVLHRIAGRAVHSGLMGAAEVTSNILQQFRLGAISLDIANGNVIIPIWAECLSREFGQIRRMGLLTKELLARIEEEMHEICSPLGVNDAWAMEKALASSFRESFKRRLGRWEGKLRFALARALYVYAPQQKLSEIESALRIYNPNAPERTVAGVSASYAEAILKSICDGDYRSAIGSTDSFHLNYREIIWESGQRGENAKGQHIEVFAILIPSSVPYGQAYRAAYEASFGSTDFPNFDVRNAIGPTCLKLDPEFAILGMLTPAFPLPSFRDLVGAKDSDFSRANWRNGRSYEVHNLGRPEREGCSLSVRRSAVKIPQGAKLVWVIKLNHEHMAVVDTNNKRLD